MFEMCWFILLYLIVGHDHLVEQRGDGVEGAGQDSCRDEKTAA